MIGVILDSEDLVATGAAALAAQDARLAEALLLCGPLPLRRRSDGFEALVDAIVSQQVSTASAKAISARMLAQGLTGAEAFRLASDDDLRAAGLSRPKQKYLRALAAAEVDWTGLRSATDDEVVVVLTA